MNLPEYVVDCHVHFWNPAQLRYQWLDALPALNRAFLPEHFAAASASANVRKIVFVEGACASTEAQAEADWISTLAKHEPRLCGIVAHASLEQGEDIRTELAALATRPLVRGVRRLLEPEQERAYCLRPEFIAGVKLLAEFNFTFDLCIRHQQMRAVTELVRRVPEVSFILDHFGKPAVREGRIEPWATEMKALAALPNVSCKLSGLATEAELKNWKPADLKTYFEIALACFGYDRVMFGGDWPVATLATDYQRWLDTVSEFAASASHGDRKKLLQTNAERVYRV